MHTLCFLYDTLRYWYWRLTGRIDLLQEEYDDIEPYEVDNG